MSQSLSINLEIKLIDIITIIYYLIFLISVILIYLQLRATKTSVKELEKQRTETHEAQRREFSIKLLNDWHSKNSLFEMFIAKKLVRELPRDIKKKIMQYEAIEVSGKLKSFILLTICSGVASCNKDCDECSAYDEVEYNGPNNAKLTKIRLPEKSVILLRNMIVSYFNTLEFIASSYKHNIADREIIKEQLFYLAEDHENFRALLNEFEITKHFPCLLFLIDDIQGRLPEGKEKLGKETTNVSDSLTLFQIFKNFLWKKK